MNEKQKEFLAQSGINLTDGLAYFLRLTAK